MKNVLILTYYWPPAGGSGVQRWLKFVKYMPQFGIRPIVYTADKKSFSITDNSLMSEIPKEALILKRKVWEPENLFSLFGKTNREGAGFLEAKPGFWGRIKKYIRANYFIPDSRKYWIGPSVRYLREIIDKENIDLIISTGPPHSLHLIAMQLQKEKAVKWIADFRDPWTEIDYFHKLPLTKRAFSKHKDMEHSVVQNADVVLVVGDTMNEKYKPLNSNVITLTNGFDVATAEVSVELDKGFTMTHIGLMNADRNPSILWEALTDLREESADFKNAFQLQLVGKTDASVRKSIFNSRLDSCLIDLGYQPHDKITDLQRASQCLLLVVNNVPFAKGIVTGKVFEYLAAGRPIIAIGPEGGDLDRILTETDAGTVIGFHNKAQLKKQIKTYFNKYKEENLKRTSQNIDKYHRRELTMKLVSIIEETLS